MAAGVHQLQCSTSSPTLLLRVGVRGAGLAAGIVAPVVVSAPCWVLMDLLLQAQVAVGPVGW